MIKPAQLQALLKLSPCQLLQRKLTRKAPTQRAGKQAQQCVFQALD